MRKRFLYLVFVKILLQRHLALALPHPCSEPLTLPPEDLPVVMETSPVQNLLEKGFATIAMDEWAIRTFGFEGSANGWMKYVPGAMQITLPFEGNKEWSFYQTNPSIAPNWRYVRGENLELDRELYEVLGPAVRELGHRLISHLNSSLGHLVRSNGNIVLVKSVNGHGSQTWHRDNQEHLWDARVIGVVPFGAAPPTQAFYQNTASTPPTGHFVCIRANQVHRGIATPGRERAIIAIDVKIEMPG